MWDSDTDAHDWYDSPTIGRQLGERRKSGRAVLQRVPNLAVTVLGDELVLPGPTHIGTSPQQILRD